MAIILKGPSTNSEWRRQRRARRAIRFALWVAGGLGAAAGALALTLNP